MIKLPDKLSELIRLALRDLAAVEANPTYKVSMCDSWHEPHGKVCHVCLAGAVMAKTLATSPREDKVPYEYPDTHTVSRLLALDYVRVGNVDFALVKLKLGIPETLTTSRIIPQYDDDPTEFRQAIETLADDLAAHGL
jgi:hypothetical protein